MEERQLTLADYIFNIAGYKASAEYWEKKMAKADTKAEKCFCEAYFLSCKEKLEQWEKKKEKYLKELQSND